MSDLPSCPKCDSEYTYEDGNMFVCPECAYEWSKDSIDEAGEDEIVIKDSVGNTLQDGDTVTVIKDLKVKGASSDVKIGTKFKIGRLLDKPDHNIDCKISGYGAMQITAAFVKKV